MSETFDLIIRSPEEDEFVSKAKSISFTSEGGDLQIFAEHASITNSIQFSPVYVETPEGGADEIFFIRSAVFTFNNTTNSAILMASYCVKEGEVSLKTAHEYREFLEKQLQEGKSLSDFEILYLQGEHLAVLEQIKHVEK